MKRSHIKKIIIIIGSIILLFAAVGIYLYAALDTPEMTVFKRHLKYDILKFSTVNNGKEKKGLKKGYTITEYENGVVREGEFDEWQDNHRVYEDGEVSRLVSYYGGYQIDLPADAVYDFDYSAGYVKASGDGFSVVISREYAPYQSAEEIKNFRINCVFPILGLNRGVEDYVSYYEYRFLLDENWQKTNGVTLTDLTKNKRLWIYKAVLSDAPDGEFDGYTYVTALKDTREYIRIVFKYDSNDAEMSDFLLDSVENMRIFDPRGNGHYSTDFNLVTPENWSDETKALFNDISKSDTVKWGIFVKNVATDGINKTIPELEKKLDYNFDVVLHYVHLSLAGNKDTFPTEFMEQNQKNGKLVELTYQMTNSNNGNLFGKSAMLDAYRGLYDDAIREFAVKAKEFGHPFLFRLNNEQNSDWCTYSGVVNMCDPDIFVAVWQRIYGIFEEVGVDNCIWIYNPNDRNCPPSIWNDSLAYYPGDGYVHMLGVTGYNNGTYYKQWAEEWREFDFIYSNIENLNMAHYGDFPWIITEFASSSIGGDKAAWIDNMFGTIGNYENIKIAVWFSYADFDGNIAARPYWLDENEETIAAFRRGFAKYKK